MINIMRFDLSTGSLEIIGEASTMDAALEFEDTYRHGDHGTDIVTWVDDRGDN